VNDLRKSDPLVVVGVHPLEELISSIDPQRNQKRSKFLFVDHPIMVLVNFLELLDEPMEEPLMFPELEIKNRFQEEPES